MAEASINIPTKFTVNNIIKGTFLESIVKEALSTNYNIEPHKVTQPGVDVKASNQSSLIVAECINWYGGYIHPKRFDSIVKNLLAYPNAHKHLICAGVKPTQEQWALCNGYGIKVIHLPKQLESSNDCIKVISQALGVITYTTSNTSDVSLRLLSKIKTYFEPYNIEKSHLWRCSLALELIKKPGLHASSKWIQKILHDHTFREYVKACKENKNVIKLEKEAQCNLCSGVIQAGEECLEFKIKAAYGIVHRHIYCQFKKKERSICSFKDYVRLKKRGEI